MNGHEENDRVVAVGLLTRREVSDIGAHLSRLYPVEEESPFSELLEAIDEADRRCRRRENAHSD